MSSNSMCQKQLIKIKNLTSYFNLRSRSVESINEFCLQIYHKINLKKNILIAATTYSISQNHKYIGGKLVLDTFPFTCHVSYM